jgi:hypothetical protein
MKSQQIGRINIPSSHCRYIQKALSELLLQAAQYGGCQYRLHIKQRSTSNPAPSESTTAHATKNIINITTASAATPWFPDRKKSIVNIYYFMY